METSHTQENIMKKWLLAAALAGASTSAFAVSPGGPGCGWGNMLFDGSNGPAPHIVAYTTNGTSGNATFGMTSGTNGCSTNSTLTYGGQSLLAMNGVMDEVAQDMAVGHGEALTALSVSMGIAEQDRAHFDQVMHAHFASIFPSQDVNAAQVMNNINAVMQQDTVLAKYA